MHLQPSTATTLPVAAGLPQERLDKITSAVDRYLRMHGGDTDSAKNREFSPHLRSPQLVLAELDIEVSPEELDQWRAYINYIMPLD